MVEVVDQVVPNTKRKRFNKNKKKAWRKRTNITDVEDKLEEERREERYGGPLEEKSSNELLFLDVGDEAADREVQDEMGIKDEDVILEYTLDKVPGDSGGSGKKIVELKPSTGKRRIKSLKSHQFLNGLQGARAPRKPRAKREVLAIAMKKKQQLEAKGPTVAKKFKQAVKQIEAAKEEASNRPKSIIKNKFTLDLWSEGGDDVTQECKKKGLEESFIKDISFYYRAQRKLRPVKVPKNRYVKPSKLKPVLLPEAGTSYNPSYIDHQKLLQKAVSQEATQLRKIERIERATTRMFPTVDKAPTAETWLEEMSQGLPKAGGEEEEEEVEMVVEKEKLTVTSKPKNEKKTKKQRRKEQKLKLAKLKRLQQKEQRVRSSNIFRVKTYQKEIDQSEDLTKKRILGRSARKEQLKSMPHRLGRLRFEEEDIAVTLGDELPDCLRRAAPAVDLIEERFKSLQRRNVIEPRLPHKLQRKYKLKKTVKRSYKEEFAKIEKMVDE
nr:ribosome biogenesis protein NOP53-like [Procambarus clarkii]